jgi:hypothetical protein
MDKLVHCCQSTNHSKFTNCYVRQGNAIYNNDIVSDMTVMMLCAVAITKHYFQVLSDRMLLFPIDCDAFPNGTVVTNDSQ